MRTIHFLSVAEAKTRLRIPDLWAICGLPDRPRKSCCCPFHDDRTASFSISSDGLLWHCFAGCGGGDAVDFLGQARHLSRSDACCEFLRLAGAEFRAVPRTNHNRISCSPKRAVNIVSPPGLTPGTETDWRKLASLRSISSESIPLATQRGLLRFGTHKLRDSWFITDGTGHNVQARRMDGEPWQEIGGIKAWTLAGSLAAWPVGIKEAAPFPCLAVCEGGPDLLAAFHFILCEGRDVDCAAVAILGASLTIHSDALPFFAGKRVRIFGHADASGAGTAAVERWAGQLARAGANVDAFDFAGLKKADGLPVNDLNDCTSICADDFEDNRELWSLMP